MKLFRGLLAALGAAVVAIVAGAVPQASAEDEADVGRLPPGAEAEATTAGPAQATIEEQDGRTPLPSSTTNAMDEEAGAPPRQEGMGTEQDAAAAAAEEKRKADASDAQPDGSVLDKPAPVEEPAALPGEGRETRI